MPTVSEIPREPVSTRSPPSPVPGRRAVRLVPALGIPMVLLFGGAGRWHWPAAWVYLALVAGGILAAMIVFAKLQPGLTAERSRWREGKAWDRPLVFVLGIVGPAAVQLVCGLDKRLAWSTPVSPAAQFGAGVLFAAGMAVTAWAMAVNTFFSATVRIQTDRGHYPVADGPYRVVRHPAYAAMITCTAAGPVLLGTLVGLIPAAAVIGVFVVRTALEDRTLRDELPGYAEYARRVRWRLVPGVW